MFFLNSPVMSYPQIHNGKWFISLNVSYFAACWQVPKHCFPVFETAFIFQHPSVSLHRHERTLLCVCPSLFPVPFQLHIPSTSPPNCPYLINLLMMGLQHQTFIHNISYLPNWICLVHGSVDVAVYYHYLSFKNCQKCHQRPTGVV